MSEPTKAALTQAEREQIRSAIFREIIGRDLQIVEKAHDAADRAVDAVLALPALERPDALIKFARWALTEGPFDGCDLDGGSVQNKAEKLGLIIKTKYDPAIHGESHECAPGDDWFVFAPLIAEKREG